MALHKLGYNVCESCFFTHVALSLHACAGETYSFSHSHSDSVGPTLMHSVQMPVCLHLSVTL